ncbi:MAG: hypothetical protein GY926_18865 [bacterium]|nr:hypothetical protein [bacterium]
MAKDGNGVGAGAVMHRELAAWRRGHTEPDDFMTVSMANYLAATGRMSPVDVARVSRGGLTVSEQDRIFSAASYGRPLGSLPASGGPSYLERAAGLGGWAVGRVPNQALDSDGVTGSSLTNDGLAVSNLSGVS